MTHINLKLKSHRVNFMTCASSPFFSSIKKNNIYRQFCQWMRISRWEVLGVVMFNWEDDIICQQRWSFISGGASKTHNKYRITSIVLKLYFCKDITVIVFIKKILKKFQHVKKIADGETVSSKMEKSLSSQNALSWTEAWKHKHTYKHWKPQWHI